MRVTIDGSPKEIAALVLAAQERRRPEGKTSGDLMSEAFSQGLSRRLREAPLYFGEDPLQKSY